ncbi:hypothetical protein VTN77DRAFT_8693 [Rasamsonia byssochlamydoides]|uniref:uncharacterized protein n=1 Tax=Rasamsonia byssochlamydoides TaxID=89139 RepID=UPI003742D1CA
MASTDLTLQPPTAGPQFNWFFLVELIVCGILSLFFFFYFNRLFATLVSYGVRAYTWHYYRAYVDIQALQISLLGGRIFFKGIRYHGVNETILVHGGYVTWNYWKRAVKRVDLARARGSKCRPRSQGNSDEGSGGDNDSEYVANRGETGGVAEADRLPCRIVVTVYGLEWFLYNRTPAYDDILSGFARSGDRDSVTHASRSPSPGAKSTGYDSSRPGSGKGLSARLDRASSDTSVAEGSSARNRRAESVLSSDQHVAATDSGTEDSISKFLQLLPVKVECTKGAIVAGNENTRSVLTVTFEKASGLIDASDAGPLDLYRQLFTFEFTHPIIQLRPNPDFKELQLAAARTLSSTPVDEKRKENKRASRFNYQRTKREIWHSIRGLVPYFQKSVESFHVDSHYQRGTDMTSTGRTGLSPETRWRGLTRYLDENTDEHEGWNAVEYGRFSTLVDCPSLTLSYYWDVPGKVPSEQAELSSIRKVSQDINGSNPPEWGLDLKIEGGTINYGPWADRERVGLQNVFFPNPFRSAQPAELLTPGALRRSTSFRLRVEISQDTTLRIPTREESKDWQWKGRADAIRGLSKFKKQKQKRESRNKDSEKGKVGPEIRPFGWLTLRVSRDSTITYNMDMVASKTGYHNYLTLDLRDSRMSSSVNHGLLWQCPRQIISCDLSNPLTWNSLHRWEFNVESRDMELFLLRDHIFLITDLVSDWTSGSVADYYTFVPFVYNIKLLFTNFRLFMNVNDSNIINNPSDLDDNTFVVVKGKQLTSHVGISATKYKPEENTVTFGLNLQDGGLDLLTPLWHTLHTFLRDKAVATLNDLTINGSYTYNSATSRALTDTLLMDIAGRSPRLYLYGFLIRYFMRIRENYFGEEMHFKTLEEFQEAANAKEQPGAHGGMNPNRKSNDLDVIIRVAVDSPCVLLPTNIYDHSKSLRLTAASIDSDMRFTNYYMDLQTGLSPVEVALESLDPDNAVSVSNTQFFIDGVSIYGHRLFGLPPTEPTYVCNWDFEVGKVVGECSPDFLRSLTAALRDVGFTLDDEENALPPLHPVALHDVTFLRARVESVHVSVLVDRTALILASDAITVQFNDWARWRFSKRLSLTVPNISVAAVDRKSAARWQGKRYGTVTTYALFETNVKLTMLQRKSNFYEERRLQQEHIRVHDQRTHRTPWLLLDSEQADGTPLTQKGAKVDPPAMAVPSMPQPVVDGTGLSDFSSSSSVLRFQSSLKHRSSFLSLGASSLHSKNSIPKGRMSRSKSQISEIRSNRGSALSNEDPVSGDKVRHVRQRGETKFYLHDNSLSEEPQLSMIGLSSPWAMPYFQFYNVVPDSTQLPPLPAIPPATETAFNDHDSIENPADDKAAHVDIFCELAPGLRGFCTPEFLFALSSLVQGLQPPEPVDIIDSLQTDVISDITKYEKAMKSPKATSSFSVRIPSTVLRLINSSNSENDSQFQFQDEYKVSFTHLKATLRTKVERKEDDLVNGIQQNLAVHAAADMLSVSALGRRADAFQEQAELNCSLREIMFWLATVPSMQANLQMRSFETVTSTKSVEPLAFLVQRTTTLLDSVTSSFQQASSSTDRLRYLVWSLTESAAGIPDPLFLTRPSSVLRASRSHLRLHDSWKILSRLRNIYKNLSPDKQQALKTNCIDLRNPCPQNAKSKVVQSFDEWRPWDLAHVEKSYAMKKIWGDFDNQPNDDAPIKSTTFSCAVKTFSFFVDPGPKESDFIVEGLFIAFALSSPKRQKEVTLEGRKKIMTLRSYCSSAALRLRWEILDLVEGVTRTMSNITLESAAPVRVTEVKEETPVELHVVLGADVGSITLDGINLGLALMGYGLKGSLVHRPQHAELQEQMSVLLSAEDCSAKFSNRSKVLMLWEVWKPNVYSSYMLDKSQDNVVYDWKVACSCRKLLYDMKEDPLGLIHAADRVVEDEVRYVRDLLQRLELQTTSRPSTPPTEKPASSDVHQFHVALFLDDYQINLCLLPSLNYAIYGEVARMSVMSSKGSGIEVDFDVKSNYHVFQSMEEGQAQTVSEVDVPPINGRILGRLSPDLIWLKADVTVELIRLQASALRSLLSVVNRPEISHFASDFRESVEELHLHFEDVLVREVPTPRSSVSSKSREILYNIQLTMAGMGIHARAPGLRSKEYSADMDFSFGAMQMRLDNASEQQYPSGYPEFHINVSQIALELRRQEKSQVQPYGSLVLDAGIVGTSRLNERNEIVRAYHLTSKSLDVELFAETASLVIDIAAHLQERIKTLDLSEDMKRFRNLGRLARPRSRGLVTQVPEFKVTDEDEPQSQALFSAMYSVELANIQASWIMHETSSAKAGHQPEDLVFSIRYVTLSTTKENAAKLRIQDMQLQMTPKFEDKRKRSLNSALMPEIVFNVAYLSTKEDLRLAFQAAGKSLDIRATTEFILPASLLQNSIASASEKLREANAIWATSPSQSNSGNGLFGNKRLSSLLVDVDFAGAIVSLLGRQLDDQQTLLAATVRGNGPAEGKYGQYVQGDSATTASLRAPGVALKVQYGDSGTEDPTLNAELRVSPSSNVLYPTVVPLIKQISASIKEVVGEQDEPRPSSSSKLQPHRMVQDTSLDATNPETILGRCKLNIGLRICKQEFSLSCQPIARVAATARFDDIYVTVNTVQSAEQRRFFAILIAFNSLQASVKHVYSNESTASFEVESIVMSLMNSKHVSTSSGISAILKVSPMKIMVNAKQVQDFLLFREIWVPSGDEATFTTSSHSPSPESQALIVQRYQQVASAGAFPWNTAIAIDELDIQLDLGQTLGKAEFTIKDLWVSSKKTSDWEQNLCGGFDTMAIESKGRMSGSVELRKLKVRTFIKWPDETPTSGQTPLIQASVAFDALQANASFEYQPFLVADIGAFAFLMYNVRSSSQPSQDRLVSILEGEKVQVFCTTLTASQSLALFQAWQRLVQDKYAAYEASLKEIEKYLRRKSVFSTSTGSPPIVTSKKDDSSEKAPISLHTDVVVTIQAINVGAFPSTFFDNQIFKMEARDAQARFAVSLEQDKIHSALGLTLGELRVALSSINRPSAVELAELSVSEVAARATGSRGGTILKVPRVVASMETWQTMASNEIEYIFKSAFEGKVDVGWNYSRISFIRGMWTSHSRALASRLGKPLPPSAVRITGGPKPESEGDDHHPENGEQQKITAVVNVPQSKYVYRALEPPLIETPQLRDMGEATPPLEWIGLHRDKLPNITHQIIIVTLLEVAKEVEDAYSKILG